MLTHPLSGRSLYCILSIWFALCELAIAQGSRAAQLDRMDQLMSARRFRDAQGLAEHKLDDARTTNASVDQLFWGRHLARADVALDRFDRAEALLQKYIAHYSQSSESILRKSVAVAQVDLAMLYAKRSQFDESDATIRQALAMLKPLVGPERADFAHALNTAALCLVARGNYSDAESIYWQAIDIYDKTVSQTHPNRLATFLNLSDVFHIQHRFGEEGGIVQQIIDSCRKEKKTDDPVLVLALQKRGELLGQIRKLEEAESSLREALATSIRIDGDGTSQIAEIQTSLAGVVDAQGHAEQAERLLDGSLKIFEKSIGPDHPPIAHVLMLQGRLISRKEKYAEAYRKLDRAVRILERSGQAPDDLFNAYVDRALYRANTGQIDKMAFDDLRLAMNLAETQRARSGGGSLERVGYFSSFNSAFALMVGLQAQLGDKCDASEVLTTMERFHARVLLEQMEACGRSRDEGRPSDEHEAQKTRERQLFAAHNEAHDRWARETDPVRKEGFLQELIRARNRLNEHFRNVDETSPLFRKVTNRVPNLADLRRELLKPGDMLCEYLITEFGGEVLVVTHDTAKVFHMGLNVEEAKVMGVDPGGLDTERLRKCFSNPSKTGLHEQLSSPEHPVPADKLRVMWNTLFGLKELQVALTNGSIKRLFVIPDGLLSSFPFEAMVVNSGPKLEYLLDKGPTIVYAPSAAVLLTLGSRAAVPTIAGVPPVLAVGDPAYDGKSLNERKPVPAAPPVKSNPSPSTDAGKSKAPDNREALAKSRFRAAAIAARQNLLKASLGEVEMIAKSFENVGIAVTQLKVTAATEGAVRSAIPQRKILHLACHGEAELAYGNLFGALIFAPGSNGDTDPNDDGYLTLKEISSLDLQAVELATLSACLTNVGSDQMGEGTMSLTRGFLVAGARRVISTNWSVGDNANAKLMAEYGQLLAPRLKSGWDIDYATPLRDAKRNVRKTVGLEKPFYWAAPILVGPP